ncbi:SDR family oxidoreductase [uncultured Cohaesibacter sp.]|uniref:SDR family oxidoreductase n=1 Tax=uncultured Cohaesibacter sp. TaxID=1002546 RepID=UPI0029C89FF1|nr:SDR family oxidoreductase [uncultured Cohaesibacter sp.]
MTNQLESKLILIIGGTSGFGLEVAKAAVLSEARLVLIGRDPKKAEAVAGSLKDAGHQVDGFAIDATDADALGGILKQVGPVDHMVSTVGGAMGGGFLEADLGVIRDTVKGKFDDNLVIARTVAPFLAEGGSMTFTAGSGGRPDNASGAIIGNQAIAGLVKGLAVELAPRRRANAVAPTWTPTPLWRNVPSDQVEATRAQFAEQIPLGRTGEPAEIAEAFLFLMSCNFITGQTLTVDGGYSLIG